MSEQFVMADTAQVAYTKETSWGTTPATPVFQKLRLTKESFAYSPQTTKSTELNPNRDVSDLVLTAANTSGGIDFELSYGTFDDIFSSLFYADWATNVLKNGITQKPLSFEKRFYRGTDADNTALYDYYRYTGMVANTMSLSVQANDKVTGSFDFMGKGGTTGTDIITGATYTDATTSDILNASSDVGTLSITGITGYTPKVLSISLNVNNNLKGAGVVGSLDYADIGAGAFDVSGSLELYYEKVELYQAFLDSTALSLAFTIGKTTGNKYTFSIPKLKLGSCPIQAEGQNSYVMCKADFTALKDATLGGTMSITRAVA